MARLSNVPLEEGHLLLAGLNEGVALGPDGGHRDWDRQNRMGRDASAQSEAQWGRRSDAVGPNASAHGELTRGCGRHGMGLDTNAHATAQWLRGGDRVGGHSSAHG